MSRFSGAEALAAASMILLPVLVLSGCVATAALPSAAPGGADDTALTAAQRDYLYDYYLETLVPCLELEGVAVENPPRRDEFAATGVGMGWNPYYAMDALSFGEVVADDALLSACPPFPKDSRFDEWRAALAG